MAFGAAVDGTVGNIAGLVNGGRTSGQRGGGILGHFGHG